MGQPAVAVPSHRARERAKSQPIRASTVLIYILLIGLAVIFASPFLWTISTSLKETQEIYSFPPTLLPVHPQWGNYARVLELVPYAVWVRNSVFLVVAATLGGILTSSLVAYSFARFRYRGRDLLFLITLGTMMLPAQVTLIPQYILFHEIGWVNTLLPLWVPAWFGGGAFNIFLLRQFFLTLPRELDEAAVIDGAGTLRIFSSILIPLCKPALATLTIFSVIDYWNEFQTPLIYLTSPAKFTLAVGLSFFQNQSDIKYPMEFLLTAGSIMTILPIVVLFFLTQRYFMEGIVLSGVKH